MSFIFCEFFKEKKPLKVSSHATEDHTLGGLHIKEFSKFKTPQDAICT